MVDSMFVGRSLREAKVTLFVAGRGEVRLDTFAQRAVFVGESKGGDAENEARSKRMLDSWERRRRAGKPTSNKSPYGLTLVGEQDVPIEACAPWVLEDFRDYASGIGTHRIAVRMDGSAAPHTWKTARLDDDGSRIEKTRATTRWDADRVANLLRQTRYRGTTVEPALFDAVQRRLEDTPKTGSRRKREYPLTAALRCVECHRHLHGRSNGTSKTKVLADGTKRRYASTSLRYYSCVICRYSLNADSLEGRFFSDVERLRASEDLLRTWVAAPRVSASDVTAAQRELVALEREHSEEGVRLKRDRLFDLAMSTSIDELEFKRQIGRIEDEHAAARGRIAGLRARLELDESRGRDVARARQLLSGFQRLYEIADYEQKRELVSSLATALGGASVSRHGLSWSARGDHSANLESSS